MYFLNIIFNFLINALLFNVKSGFWSKIVYNKIVIVKKGKINFECGLYIQCTC